MCIFKIIYIDYILVLKNPELSCSQHQLLQNWWALPKLWCCTVVHYAFMGTFLSFMFLNITIYQISKYGSACCFNLRFLSNQICHGRGPSISHWVPQQLALFVNLPIVSMTSPILMPTLVGKAVVFSVIQISELSSLVTFRSRSLVYLQLKNSCWMVSSSVPHRRHLVCRLMSHALILVKVCRLLLSILNSKMEKLGGILEQIPMFLVWTIPFDLIVSAWGREDCWVIRYEKLDMRNWIFDISRIYLGWHEKLDIWYFNIYLVF